MIKLVSFDYVNSESRTVVYKDNVIVYEAQGIDYEDFLDLFEALDIRCEYEYYLDEELWASGKI